MDLAQFYRLENSSIDSYNRCLNHIKNNGITPQWVQVGNETGNGMLWEDGKASTNMANYAALNNAGYDAVKAIFPTAKVIVHIQNGNDNSLFRWIFDGLKITEENGMSLACHSTLLPPIGALTIPNALLT